jgi:hypothetical protein
MHTRALALAISLLSASLAIAGISACNDDCGGSGESVALELGTNADLFAVAAVSRLNPESVGYVAVGSGGTVVVWESSYSGGLAGPAAVVTVGNTTLRSLWIDEFAWWLVGDGGTAAVSSDRGLTWTIVDVGTNADLYEIIGIGSRLVVVGDNVVLVQAADGLWSEITPPTGGWGKLRAVQVVANRIYAVGLDGAVWRTADPTDEWARESVGSSADLFDVGRYGVDEHVAVVGSGGTLLVREGGEWSRAKTGVSVDLIGWSGDVALGADGQVYEVTSRLELEHLMTFAGARAFIFGACESGIVVGEGGMATEYIQYTSAEGRPFTLMGERWRPALLRRSSTPLAAQWADAGLHEHTSVASFARFGLELLALGAPAQLVAEQLAAARDELGHARMSFVLAQRFGGVAVAAGAMPMPRGALARAGDPVATALGLFEEGCVNESLAACEAAVEAATATDPEVREVLERIAADERRHATAAWAALRWLIATYGERVRGPLRARLARLSPASELHRRVHAELIQPIARSMLALDRAASLEVR